MDYFPFFFDLRQQPVLVVGGGQIALRKVRLLVQAGAIVRLISPECLAELEQLVSTNRGIWQKKAFAPADLEACCLVVCATDNAAVNKQVSALCKARYLPVNVVDNPDLCSIITPAIIDRSPILVAISSAGAAPVLARKLKQQLETLLPEQYGKFATFCGNLRDKVKRALPENQRRYFWEKLIAGPVENLVYQEKEDAAHEWVTTNLNVAQQSPALGEVYLVGAGPGAPDLLTLRALQLMQQADVVLYDRLVSDPIMERVRRDADRVYVGKRRAEHAVEQADINQMLVDLAKEGKRVLRLKGGDPFIFGRGGEEIELLTANNIPFEVVPGITAASGCAAYAGIPLTHRDHAQSVRFITGHLKADATNIRWPELVADDQTLVFYMSLQGLPAICEALIKHGKAASTPAALIEKGTTPDQKTYTGTLESLPQIARQESIQAPTLLIIGGVVALQPELQWYKRHN
ncbi:siroheme synthase CysG [Simiduia curdlanivorans]|uniref:Siroheme synthase n=1 Tax=Simiduia curdlanivorans TaxID=1492769 RepID=A0ABV8V2T3_9GAMM|nr:siroheme synthase CysG [Simiduia curdlanivorans]MDN3639943.1 siroheme synthase CysG [Simiduia curdlanivorans]